SGCLCQFKDGFRNLLPQRSRKYICRSQETGRHHDDDDGAIEQEALIHVPEIPLEIERSQTLLILGDGLKTKQSRTLKAITIRLGDRRKAGVRQIRRIMRKEFSLFVVKAGADDRLNRLQCGEYLIRILRVVKGER